MKHAFFHYSSPTITLLPANPSNRQYVYVVQPQSCPKSGVGGMVCGGFIGGLKLIKDEQHFEIEGNGSHPNELV